jgi:hypothetical protein
LGVRGLLNTIEMELKINRNNIGGTTTKAKGRAHTLYDVDTCIFYKLSLFFGSLKKRKRKQKIR